MEDSRHIILKNPIRRPYQDCARLRIGGLAMNGAESLLRSLLANGVDVCFANPGTSEMHFVAALDDVPGMRPMLVLQ